ncbi:pentapeptide repeat-containing protein [Streptomyces sp. P9-2B-2]|uniref:pentapeptide repeat-containing protein n=1 Tax=Streptomyces sp. P9-2B-2 TaxID=3057114 RepID=UPI0025B61713|nr:pentapeptide repeat-containing protein [Streptomyces sp. P9-2B-2]WJY39230.1 pentapeptide repeat-containing protein [Streptomyces sp. P9-2B-2]
MAGVTRPAVTRPHAGRRLPTSLSGGQGAGGGPGRDSSVPPPFRHHGHDADPAGPPGDPLTLLATETDLTGLDFTGLDLRPALRRDPRPRTFTRCTFTEANLRGTHLVGIRFTEADLGGVDFRDCILEDCRLAETNLRAADFTGADLRGADLGELTIAIAAQFRGAVISPDQAAQICTALGLNVIS